MKEKMNLNKKKNNNPLKPPLPKVMVDNSKQVLRIYTDGSCVSNGKEVNKGGYAFIVVENDTIVYEYSRGMVNTTNNKMELQGIIDALQWVEDNAPCDAQIIINSDSQYCIHGLSTWYKGWISKGWKDVKNPEQWKELIALKDKLPNVQYRWVRGHQEGDNRDAKYNRRVDELATTAECSTLTNVVTENYSPQSLQQCSPVEKPSAKEYLLSKWFPKTYNTEENKEEIELWYKTCSWAPRVVRIMEQYKQHKETI